MQRFLVGSFVGIGLLILGASNVSASPLLELICTNYEAIRVNEINHRLESQKTATEVHMSRVIFFDNHVIYKYPADDNAYQSNETYKYINKRNAGILNNIKYPDLFISAYNENSKSSEILYVHKINSSYWSINKILGNSNGRNFYSEGYWYQCTALVDNIIK